MPIATGVFKKVSLKKQTALNVKAPPGPAGSARYLRRVTSTVDLAKANYTSAEILPSQQRRDVRHGVRSVVGTLSGEISVGGYQLPIESVLRRIATVGATTAALTNVTTASAGANTYAGTLTRATGDFTTDGFKIGDIVRPSGIGAGSNLRNLMITNLTATVMTVRTLNQVDIVPIASGGSITIALAGRKTFIPASGHTKDYYTLEHWYSDIAESEQFKDCIFNGMNIGLPATGMATIEFPVMGLDADYGVAEYFTTPEAAATGGIVAAANGVLIVAGTVVGTVTGLTVNVAGGFTAPGGVVGSNVDPDIFPGVLEITGSFTAFFSSGAMRTLFIEESEFTILSVMTENNSDTSGVFAITMPRCKLTGATKDDGPSGLVQTLPYQAIENTTAGVKELTSLVIQDSSFI